MLYILLKNVKTGQTAWETLKVTDDHTPDDVYNAADTVLRNYGSDWETRNIMDDKDSVVTSLQSGKQSFIKNAGKYGLDPRLYGRTFLGRDGSRYTFVGIHTKNWRYPIILTKAKDGTVKNLKTSAKHILSMLQDPINQNVLN